MIRSRLNSLPSSSSRRKPGSTCWRHARLKRGSRLSPGRGLVAALFLLLLPLVASAAVPPPVALTPQQSAELQRIAGYLNGIRTMTARFQQTAANGGGSGGGRWRSGEHTSAHQARGAI